MAKRSKDWNANLAKQLRDKEFARLFILASLNEGISLNAALAKVIRAYGIQEFAKKARIAPSNLSRALTPKANITATTYQLLLKPFGLRLGVSVLDEGKKVA